MASTALQPAEQAHQHCLLPAYQGGNLCEEVDDRHNRHEHCCEGKVVVGGGLKVEKRLGGGQANLQGSPGRQGRVNRRAQRSIAGGPGSGRGDVPLTV